MICAALLTLALLAAPAVAEDHDDHDHHDEHVAETGGVRAVHAWTNATSGSSALVYVELENTAGTDVVLTGAESDLAASAGLVGLQNTGGQLVFVPIPEMPMPAGSSLLLAPNGLAIQLIGLSQPLVQGERFEIEFLFGDFDLHAMVDIESTTATQHSHAGHQH